MKEKERVLTKTDGGPLPKKSWKITKNATCAYEGEKVHMNGKSKGFFTTVN